ncbi:MAG: hypothetical protein CO036_01795 [Candidatus Omnitrophica bacterium CG_4_9_14_0_2_um_filter_43_12]|nr:MAG: hypothetical protein COS48_04515 [Candidatus Omnitrophica bacterium CG03_land_8_20_14_0_80_43_22]PJC46657.1 MAG: hypothetical protein CO036_01795 [Candidatus Omnitrophica bacterium CG_4_9_14_0_2_um_filter_43_12]
MKKLFFFCIIFFITVSCFAQKQEASFPLIPDFTKNDRILIFAPHPDDESIGTAGVIQKALDAGAGAWVCCYTNGDANQLAFIMYEKRFTFRKGEFLHMGSVRKKETLDALKFLGVGADRVFFLGYPDFGTMRIMLKHWGNTKPYKSLFTRVSKVPYKENLSWGSPYTGESILRDVKAVFLDVKPTKIFVSHPADTNGDHQSLYLFLRVALWDLEARLKAPQIYPYLVHCARWPEPRGFYPDMALMPPEWFMNFQIHWMSLVLSAEEINKKNQAFDFYKSQIPYNPRYLHTFARSNELFGDYPVLKLKDSSPARVDWQESFGPEAIIKEKDRDKDNVFLFYAKSEGKLYIKLSLSRKITKGVTSSIYLLPYSRNTDFADMPKIRLAITRTRLRAYDKKNRVFISHAKMSIVDNDSILIEFPLASLNFPDYILSRARIHTDAVASDLSAWRVLELE